MAPQGGKPESRKRRMGSSHDTVVISISSDTDESNLESLKKQRRGSQPGDIRPAFDMLPELGLPSEVGENSLGRSSHFSDGFVSPWFFCRPSDLAADCREMLASCSRTEWAPRKCLSTARFNGEIMWLRVPSSDEELEDTASSKLQSDRAAASAKISSPFTGDCREKRRVVDILSKLVPHSEVGENSPGMPSHFSDGFAPEWFFCNLSDLAAVCSSSEWGPQKCQSTARFNGEIMWLQAPTTDEELEYTASTKLRDDRAAAAAANVSSPLTGDCHEKRVKQEAGLSCTDSFSC